LDPNDWVVLATVDRTRGLRGEVVVSSLSGGPETFDGRSVSLRRGDLIVREAKVENAWAQSGRVVLKFEGIDTIEEAERLRGVELCVRHEDRLPLEEGEYYLSDLVGCSLFDKGKPVGTVTGWQEAPGAVLLTVEHDSRESLVPFVKAICTEVDLPNRRINATLPEGLLDL
jgi:16S rRNA processing protein RimM